MIDATDEYADWFFTCDEDTQEKIIATINLLEEVGPALSRPFADTLNGSRFPSMKELRPTRTVRVFFAFDPERAAILLIGGDKTGKPQARWYKDMIRKADDFYSRHLEETRHGKDQEGPGS